MEQALSIDREVDARGLNCPLPILRMKKALNDMKSGQVLRILATDPAALRDFQAFASRPANSFCNPPSRTACSRSCSGAGSR